MNWLYNLVWIVACGTAVGVSYIVNALNADEWVTAFAAVLTACLVLWFGNRKGWLKS